MGRRDRLGGLPPTLVVGMGRSARGCDTHAGSGPIVSAEKQSDWLSVRPPQSGRDSRRAVRRALRSRRSVVTDSAAVRSLPCRIRGRGQAGVRAGCRPDASRRRPGGWTGAASAASGTRFVVAARGTFGARQFLIRGLSRARGSRSLRGRIGPCSRASQSLLAPRDRSAALGRPSSSGRRIRP